MTSVTFVTGNDKKAQYFSELIGLSIEHQKAEVHEIQSLEPLEICEYKAKDAYKQIKKPVIVEDVSVVIYCLGRLPGPFIKWFEDELGLEGICRLADADEERKAVASCVYSYFDGERLIHFEGSLDGTIAQHPRGDSAFGWNPTFIPQGTHQTLAEMDDTTFKSYYLKIKPITKLKEFLAGLDSGKA